MTTNCAPLYTLCLLRGDSYNLDVVYQTGDPPTPVDLTGYGFRFVAIPPASIGTVADWTTAPQINVNTAQGRINVLFTEAVTSTWVAGKGSFQLRIAPPGGEFVTILMGVMEVLESPIEIVDA